MAMPSSLREKIPPVVLEKAASARAGVASAWKAVATFVTKKVYPLTQRYKLSAYALAAGLIAIMSYTLSNIWKESIDEEIKDYQKFTSQLSAFESKFAPPEKPDTARYENNMASRRRGLAQHLRTVEGNSEEVRDRQEEDNQIMAVQDFELAYSKADEFEKFLKSVPFDVTRSSETPSIIERMTWRVKDQCNYYKAVDFLNITEDGGIPGSTPKSLHRQYFSDQIGRFKSGLVGWLPGGSNTWKASTIEEERRLAKLILRPIGLFGLSLAVERWENSPNMDTENPRIDRLSFKEERGIAYGCVRDIYDLVGVAHAFIAKAVKDNITERYVTPREIKKKRIDLAEKSLYLLGIVVGLLGGITKTPPDPKKPIAAPASYRKPRPVRREPRS